MRTKINFTSRFEQLSKDWIFLSAALLGTAVAVINNQGSEALANDYVTQIVDTSALAQTIDDRSDELCADGLVSVQRKETARAATAIARGQDVRALDVQAWSAEQTADRTTAFLMQQFGLLMAVADKAPDAWSKEHTQLAILACALGKRTSV